MVLNGQDERNGRVSSLFTKYAQFPKLASGPFRPRNAMKDKRLSTLDVAGSIPVFRPTVGFDNFKVLL